MSITTSVILPDETNNRIKHICVDEKITKAEWIRQAIDKKLESYKEE